MFGKTLVGIILLIVVAMLILGGCRHHCRLHHRLFSHERKAKWLTRKIFRELNLNDEQKTILEATIHDIHARVKTSHQEKETTYETLFQEVQKDSMDADILNSFIEDKEAAHKEVRAYCIDKMIEFHKTLTPAQRTKLALKMREFHQKHKH